MSITAETAKAHAHDPAVLCCRAEAGITIEPANLEDPAIFDDLVDSGSVSYTHLAIKGSLNPGDHVITTVLEHNSVLRPLYEMEKNGVELSIIRCDEKGMPDISQMEASIKENTKMIICTNGSNLTGNYVDV